MSSSQTTTTPQVDEVAVDAAQVQPTEKAAEVPVANNKVVDENNSTGEVDTTQQPEGGEQVKPAEAPEKPATDTTEKSAESQKEDQVVPDESKPVADSDNKVVAEESSKADNNGKAEVEASEPVKEGEVAVPAAEATNGDNNEHSSEVSEKVAEPTEETNGVCKRKNDSSVEAVDEEKTPKKAKVVDEGDQAPVEETAA